MHKKMDHFEKVLRPFSECCDTLKVHLEITITAGSPMKAIFIKEASKLKPTHVVLDRNLRKDKLFYKEHLSCDLFIFSQSNEIECLHDRHGLVTHNNSLMLSPALTAGGGLYSCAIPSPLIAVKVEGGKIEGEVETAPFSCGPQLHRSTSLYSKLSDNFIDLCMLESSEGRVPVWSFDDSKRGYESSYSSVQELNYSVPKSALITSSLQTWHAKNVDNAPIYDDDIVDKFVDPKQQLPLLKDLFDSHDYDATCSEAMQADKKPADLHQVATNATLEDGIVFDLKKRAIHTVKKGRESVLLNNFTQPPPLCSVCNLRSPDFGRAPIVYGLNEIKAATNDFSAANLIAEGGFGFVYKGLLHEQAVAIKRLKSSSLEGDPQFSAEVEALSYAQHMNLVRLVGFCVEAHEQALVYEYVCNGSLNQHLSGDNGSKLNWPSRYRIAVGAARGLRYLHEECRVGCIVHCDMRPSNILLTHDFTAMVGDSGLAKMNSVKHGPDKARAIDTLGYAAPEYIETRIATSKTDVYAYGVVLLELITGLQAIDLSKPKGEICLTEWARPKLVIPQLDELVDQTIIHSVDAQELIRMVKAAAACITRNSKNRPNMSQILRILEGDFDDAILQPNPTVKRAIDKEDDRIEEQRNTFNLLDSTMARAAPTVNRNWRSWVKTE